jgi:hypothetical protein
VVLCLLAVLEEAEPVDGVNSGDSGGVSNCAAVGDRPTLHNLIEAPV